MPWRHPRLIRPAAARPWAGQQPLGPPPAFGPHSAHGKAPHRQPGRSVQEGPWPRRPASSRTTPDLAVTYTVDPSGLSGDSLRLPQISRRMTPPATRCCWRAAPPTRWRCATATTILCTAARYTPPGAMARDLMEAMEAARCEAVGARRDAGHGGQHRRQDRPRGAAQGLWRDPRCRRCAAGPPPRAI